MRVFLLVLVAACATDRTLPEAQPATGVHPTGILDESSDNFHGKELARRGYDLNICASCHGAAFDGGEAGVTCRGCHPAGPDACVTCHEGGPTSGAHLAHHEQTCGNCHVVPTRWDDDGHVRRNGAADPAPAEVTFGALAATPTPDRQGPPSYDNGTCTNVYCHGAALHAGGGTTTSPTWAMAPTGGCTQCHGAPPPSHAQSECTTCHKDAPHLDGKLEVGSDCNSCHRSTPVFTDLAGSTTSFVAGAHQAHLTGTRLRGPLACDECHRVPAAVTDPGHIDSIAPAEVTFGALAHGDNAVPVWDRLTGTCSGTYCHGNGIYLSADPVAGTLRSPAWTGANQAYCGACHGVPPTTHAQNLTLGDCAGCHPSVDAQGNPIVNGFTSRHMDGVVDVL